MKKIFIVVFLGVVMSMFYYPFSFTFLPASLNTKMMLAVLGLLIFSYDSLRNHAMMFAKEILYLAVIAAVFSVSCFMSVTVNDTSDSSYSTYIVSFFVWYFSAYSVCTIFRWHYGSMSLTRLITYLTWVGVVQCILAQMIDNIPSFQMLVDSIVEQGGAHLREINRLYGIGAALDPAGVRFAITLLLLSFKIVRTGDDSDKMKWLWGDYFAFIIILVLGSMISRTTFIGAVLGLGYIFVYALANMSREVKLSQLESIAIILAMLAVLIPVAVYLYNTNANVHDNLRFAFEGFFNWVEQGEWRTDSTDKLNGVMWIWPHDLRTWVIGSGLFEGWVYSTDIGYCRFILYCGLLGFSIFCLFFVYNAYAFSTKFEGVGLLALLLLSMTFIVWIKVSTDLFMIYALLLCADEMIDDEEEGGLEEIE